MGVDRSLHLGPYAECVYADRTRTVKRDGCAMTTCTNYGRGRAGLFCEGCGARIGKVSVEVDDRPDVMGLTDEALVDAAYEDCAIVMANVHRDGAPEDVDGEEAFDFDLRSRDMAAEVAWFEKAFAPELAKLRETFATVEVKWGIVQWFS